MVVVEIPAQSTAMDKAHTHEGEEACHVLEGQIEVLYGDETHSLSAADSIHWDSRIARVMRNPGDSPAKVIIARTPPGLMDMRFAKTPEEAGNPD